MTATRVAIYCRVSTSKQELENQLAALQAVAPQRGYEIVTVYTDVATGKSEAREGFKRMLEDAARGKFQAVFVWALDRLSREGLGKTVYLIEHLDRLGVRVISYSEPYLDTTNELARNILLAVLATLAKAEREKISERTKAGLQRLKRQGRKLGRPALPEDMKARILDLAAAGQGIRAIGRMVKVSPTTVSRVLRGVSKRGPENEGRESASDGVPVSAP